MCGDWCGVTGTGGAEWEQRMSSHLTLGLHWGALSGLQAGSVRSEQGKYQVVPVQQEGAWVVLPIWADVPTSQTSGKILCLLFAHLLASS